jgi:hypothetical protein
MSIVFNGKADSKSLFHQLAEAKNLPIEFLQELGVRDAGSSVEIPYFDIQKKERATRLRIALKGERFRWPPGTKISTAGTYGDWRLDLARVRKELTIVEGETDCWALWYHNIPALGIPGASNCKALQPEHLDGVQTAFIVREPGQSGDTFVPDALKRLKQLGFAGVTYEIRMPDGIKDPADLHCQYADRFSERWLDVRAEARDLASFNGDGQEHRNGQARRKDPEPADAEGFVRSPIRTGDDLKEMTEQALTALQARNQPPFIFRHGGLARIEHDDQGQIIARPLDKGRMQYELARAAQWYKVTVKGENQYESPATPPRTVIEDVLATPEPPFPVLTRIVQAPIFGPDGALHDKPGYNGITKTYYEPAPGFKLDPIPDKPTYEQIGEAARFIYHEPIGDFPFIGDPERATAVAAMLLPFVRDVIEGPTPLHLFEKPTQGTGATLLTDVLTYPALGGHITAMTEGKDEDEWRKRTFAKLRSAPAAVLIDNLRRQLDSAALSSALTAWPQWEDRLLGTSEIHRVPVRCLWLATGNNPALSGEMTRRTIRCRMDPKIDRPWLRSGFRHPDLRAWIKENRSKLVWSCLVLIRAWFGAGKPEGKQTLGMFDAWAKTIGGILDVAGIEGFLGNLDEFYEAADTEGEAWRIFIATWWEKFKEDEKLVAELWTVATDAAGLDLGEGKDQSQKTKLGKKLSFARDRTYSVEIGEAKQQIRLERGGQKNRARFWQLRLIKTF